MQPTKIILDRSWFDIINAYDKLDRTETKADRNKIKQIIRFFFGHDSEEAKFFHNTLTTRQPWSSSIFLHFLQTNRNHVYPQVQWFRNLTEANQKIHAEFLAEILPAALLQKRLTIREEDIYQIQTLLKTMYLSLITKIRKNVPSGAVHRSFRNVFEMLGTIFVFINHKYGTKVKKNPRFKMPGDKNSIHPNWKNVMTIYSQLQNYNPVKADSETRNNIRQAIRFLWGPNSPQLRFVHLEMNKKTLSTTPLSIKLIDCMKTHRRHHSSLPLLTKENFERNTEILRKIVPQRMFIQSIPYSKYECETKPLMLHKCYKTISHALFAEVICKIFKCSSKTNAFIFNNFISILDCVFSLCHDTSALLYLPPCNSLEKMIPPEYKCQSDTDSEYNMTTDTSISVCHCSHAPSINESV